MTSPSVSIVIPAKNGRPTVEGCLAGVLAQDYDGDVDVLVVDSGSTDGTLDDIAAHPSVKLHRIPPLAFDHGDTRNLGAGMTEGELIVFLVQDAEPVGTRWLADLVSNFDDEQVAGAFSRILPRPYAGPLVKRGVHGDLCYGTERCENKKESDAHWAALDPHSRRVACNFNDVSSCVRRDIWERLPLNRGMFGEDIKFARAAIEAGWTVVFDPRSEVLHSHEYEAATVHARTRVDAQMNRRFLQRDCVDSLRSAVILAGRAWQDDRAYLATRDDLSKAERLKWSALSPVFHLSEFLGFWRGMRDVLRDDDLPEAVGRPLPEEHAIKVLVVVHGFPPDSWAGVEVLSLTLGKALRRRGHEVVFFVRTPGTEDELDRSLHEAEFDDFKVYRYVNRLAFSGVDETYRFAPAEEAFAGVLRDEQPDVVHVQHMIHLSTGVVDRCRAAGVPVVVTVSDFWPRCPKVQLIRPDGTNCTRPPPGLGCAACVKDKPKWVEPLARLDALLGPLPGWWARGVPQSVPALPPGLGKSKQDAASLLRRETWMGDVLARADRVVVPSVTLKKSLMQIGLDYEAISLCAYGMDTTWLAEGPKPRVPRGDGEPLRVGFIGSLVWYKGLEVLARAVAKMAEGSVHLHVHGDDQGGSDPAVQQIVQRTVNAASAAAGDRITFHGRFAHDDLGDIHANLDVLVVPSIWQEAYGITVREAHLTGTPVLGSDIAGIAEGIEDGVDGLLFKTGDDGDLARCLQRLIDEPELGPRLAAAAPPVKTDDEEAVEMEWRYRQVICAHGGVAARAAPRAVLSGSVS